MIITANNAGLILPEGCELAVIQKGAIIDSGQHIADQVFKATGQVYLDAMDKYIYQNQIKQIADTA